MTKSNEIGFHLISGMGMSTTMSSCFIMNSFHFASGNKEVFYNILLPVLLQYKLDSK